MSSLYSIGGRPQSNSKIKTPSTSWDGVLLFTYFTNEVYKPTMPRPKRDPTSVEALELRITPPDGLPIECWKIVDPDKAEFVSEHERNDFKVLIAAQEGGTPDCRLHYHLYVETYRSRTWLTKWIYSIAHCYNGEQGNAVFFTRKPHDNTIGYVVKGGNIVARHGCTQHYIDEWLTKSAQYVRDKEAGRKREQRVKKAFTLEVREKVEALLRQSNDLRNPESILNIILNEYHEAKLTFPPRSSVENIIVTCLYPYDKSIHRNFYLKAFTNGW